MTPALTLRPYQREALTDLTSRWDAGGTRVPLVLSTGLGKGHPLETEIPTPDGWRRWGDLEPGDAVFGRDGSSTEVLEVYDRGVLETYRVTFSDESSVLVDGDHLWAVRDASNGRRWGILETRALERTELKRARGWRFHVPMARPLERKSRVLPLDPYVVGALISNGSMVSSGTQLTTPDLEVATRVAQAVACHRINDRTLGVCERYSLPGLTPVTRALGMRVGSLEKRIPAEYLEGSLEQRTDLLHGLMDGDGGGRDSSRRSVAYFTSSEWLARDVSELVTSLGGTGIVKRYDRGVKGVEYAVRILLPSSVPAFSTTRKSGAGSSSTRELQPKRAVVSVVREGRSGIKCIRVAARDSLYLITRQHIVTHNTVIFAALAGRWRNEYSELHEDIGPHGTRAYFPPLYEQYGMGRRVLVIAHTDELIEQAAKAMRRANPTLRIGIVKAGQNEVTADIVVSSRQTLASHARRAQLRNVGLIIVDEAHHAIRSNTYGAILDHFGAFPNSCQCPNGMEDGWGHAEDCSGLNPRCKVVGFTATLARGDKEKLSTVWEKCTFTRDILFGIRNGFLLDVRGERIVVPDLDMGRVRQSSGDFRGEDMAEELERTFAPEIIARDYKAAAGARKGIAFWPLVETAEHGARAFNEQGIVSEVIHGKLPKTERRAMLRRLHTGETQVIHGVAVLTEGFDEPTVDVVVIARPTRSAPLYQQMVGRVLRPNLELPPEQREKALILDVVGAGASHDLRSLIDLAPERDLPERFDEEMSLLELDDWDEQLSEEEQEQGGGQVTWEFEGSEYAGETARKAFDPLGRAQLWAQTPAGTWYMSAGGDAYVFLTDSVEGDPGTYDVVLCGKPAVPWAMHTVWGRGTEHTGLPLDMALNWGEGEALEHGGVGTKTLTGRGSGWRRKPASEKAKAHAARWGVSVQDGWNAGAVGEAIDARVAALTIDPLVQRARALSEKTGEK